MNDFEKIEHLLLSKKFEELSSAELKEVTSYFENATDYTDMRETLMQVKSTLAADKLLIKPNVELKEKLLQQFDKTYANQKPSGGNVRPFYKNTKFHWAAAASVIILISISIFAYINNFEQKGNDGMAVNYESPKKTETIDETKPEAIVGTTSEETDNKNRVTTVNGVEGPAAADESVIETEGVEDLRKEESYEIGVGENSTNAPAEEKTIDRNGDGYVGFGVINRGDNNTTREEKVEDKKESKDDANFYFNDKINATENQNLKGKEKEADRNNEPNKSIPVQNQSLFNTYVNYQQTTTDKDYWKRNEKNNPKNNKSNNVGGVAQEVLTAVTIDTSKTTSDSLKLDSNFNMERRAINIDTDKKDNNK